MSGALTLRLPDSLRAEGGVYARSLGLSLNALLAVALREYLDARKEPTEQQRALASRLPTRPGKPLSQDEAAQISAQLKAYMAENGGLPPAGVAKPVAPVAPAGRSVPAVVARPVSKVAKGQLCPCGSGRKYGKCHGKAGGAP